MSQPRLELPGLRRTVIRDKDRFCIAWSEALQFKYQFLLALLPLNVLLRDYGEGAPESLERAFGRWPTNVQS